MRYTPAQHNKTHARTLARKRDTTTHSAICTCPCAGMRSCMPTQEHHASSSTRIQQTRSPAHTQCNHTAHIMFTMRDA
eukprot:9468885-Pyramimonas_sp.AAC.1